MTVDRDRRERAQHERVRAVAGEVLAHGRVQPAERAEREAQREQRAPAGVVAAPAARSTMQTIPIRTQISISGNGLHGALGRSARDRRPARRPRRHLGRGGPAATLALVVPAHCPPAYPRVGCRATIRPTPAGSSSGAARAPGRCTSAARRSAAAAAPAAAWTGCWPRRCWWPRRCCASRSGARSRWRGCGSARRPTTCSDSNMLGIVVAFVGILVVAVRHAVAGLAPGPPLAARAARRRPRPARRRAGADLRRLGRDRAGAVRRSGSW